MLLKNLHELKKLNTNYYNNDFFLTWEKTDDEIKAVLLLAEILKELHKIGKSTRLFDTGLAVSIFRDKSTRTRFSYASAVNALGLSLEELDETKTQIAHGETERETANMISFLTETVGIRDDIYLGEGDKYQRNFSLAIQEGFNAGILHQRPSIINLQSDLDHPTQTLADLLKLKGYFGSLESLRGKKIVMSWAYSPSYGKPLSVPQGIIALMTRFGMDVTLAYPEGYDLLPETITIAKTNAENQKSKFEITHNMDDSFINADIVYPKSWASFQVMQKRTELLQNSDTAGLEKLEKQALQQNAKYKEWECNQDKMSLTKNGNALYMHCLPADITGVNCPAGEVSQEIFDRYKNDTYQEAGFKPFVIEAMILLTRFKNPYNIIKGLIKKNANRLLC